MRKNEIVGTASLCRRQLAVPRRTRYGWFLSPRADGTFIGDISGSIEGVMPQVSGNAALGCTDNVEDTRLPTIGADPSVKRDVLQVQVVNNYPLTNYLTEHKLGVYSAFKTANESGGLVVSKNDRFGAGYSDRSISPSFW
jgi:hypothetical protein